MPSHKTAAYSLTVVLLSSVFPLSAREWTDSSGKHKQQAELVTVDGELVVLKKNDGRLVTVPKSHLSKKDLEFIDSQTAKEEMKTFSVDEPVWKLENGRVIHGRVVEYKRVNVPYELDKNGLKILDKRWEKLNDWQKEIAMAIVSHETEIKVEDQKQLIEIVAKQPNKTLTVLVEGVVIESKDGERFATPFFLFSERDLKILKPGWTSWMEAEEKAAAEDKETMQRQQSTMLRSVAKEYQRTQDALLQIQMLQYASQWFDLWEVQLETPNAVKSVVIAARDSLTAQEIAAQQNPGWAIGAVRALNRRW